ncbi:MAG: DUF4126 domain-containing protein [Planctomycetota bacterium]
MQITEVLLAVSLGIGLAAAAGFRVFVPMFVMSLAAASGHLTLGPSMEWLGSPLACVILGVATAVEIAAFYVPWVDNALDALASPGAVVAGSIVAAAATSQVISMDPAMHWTIGIIAGGGTAGVIQATTVATRAASTLVSGGVTNPVVSTVEVAAASTLSIVAIILPALAAIVVLAVFVYAIRRWTRRRTPEVDAPAEPTSIPSL